MHSLSPYIYRERDFIWVIYMILHIGYAVNILTMAALQFVLKDRMSNRGQFDYSEY